MHTDIDSYVTSVIDAFEASYCLSDKVKFKSTTRYAYTSVLTYFLIHPDAVLTHKEILDEILHGTTDKYSSQQYLTRLVNAGILDRDKVVRIDSAGKAARPVYGYSGSSLFLRREDPSNFQYLQFKKQYRYAKRITYNKYGFSRAMYGDRLENNTSDMI